MKLLYTHIDNVPIITLTSENGKNKLDVNALRELSALINNAENDGKSCLVITGAGQNFCLGGDLAKSSGNYSTVKEFGRILTDTLLEISRQEMIIIAAVNGQTAGGGMSLLEACDLAVATAGATFSIPEVKIGMPPVISYSGTYRMVGRKRANEMALFASELSAKEALLLGIINQIVEDPLKTCIEMAKTIEKNGAFCNKEIKLLSVRMDNGAMEKQLKSAADRLNGIVMGV